jgi:predicted nucleic acid-binding protein
MVSHFLDTNVLLYAISPHPEEATKHAQAEALLDQDDGALSVQVLQEFYVQATRPTRAGRLPHDLAVGLIRT